MNDASTKAVGLALDFLERVWGPTHELSAIDELMTEDYRITSGGKVIAGRGAFKQWVAGFQQQLAEARTDNVHAFSDPSGSRVVSRWVCTGKNNGILGLPADGRRVSFTGIAIWSVKDGRLAECWVERAAYELYEEMTAG